MTYTPSTQEVRAVWSFWRDYGGLTNAPHSATYPQAFVEFDAWLSAHDAEVRADERAKIATAIRSKFLGPDAGRNFDGSESPAQKLYDAYDEGLESAALIAEDDRG